MLIPNYFLEFPPCGLGEGVCFGGLLLLPPPDLLPVVLGIPDGFGLPGFTVVFAILDTLISFYLLYMLFGCRIFKIQQ